MDQGDASERKRLVLLVDDATDDVQMYTMALTLEGFRTRCTADMATAFHIALTDQPDVIVTDLHLPQLNGYVLLESIGAELKTRNIPLIVVTADASREARERARTFRPAEFHVKPLLPEFLVAAVRRVLRTEALA
jgi:DNA-binding response OmpR family regulator